MMKAEAVESSTLTKNLPNGWRWAQLRELCTEDRSIVEPDSPAALERPYLSLEHIESNSGRIVLSPAEAVSTGGRSTTFAFDERHVLYGKLRPYLNKVALPDFSGRCTTELIPLLPKEGVDRSFLAWVLRRKETVDAAMRESTGSRMPRADMDVLFGLEIPVPPLAEQQRIVALLNEQIAIVQQAKDATEAQLEAANLLPPACLHTIFDSPEAHKWPKKLLGEMGEIISGITLGRKVSSSETRPVPYLRVANVKDGHLDLSDVYTIQATEAEITKCRLVFGDILLTEGGDPDKLGRGTFWEEQIAECIHQNHIFRVRFDLSQFSPYFLSAQIGSPYGKRYFLAHAKQTTGIATINQKVIAGFPLMTPPLSEQERIASLLIDQLAAVEQARKAAAEQLETIKQLPAILLQRAFNGEL